MTLAKGQRNRYAVLCVDDDPAVLAALQRDLEGICGPEVEILGYESSNDLLEDTARLEKEGLLAAVVIADQVMPGMEGVDLLIALSRLPHFRLSQKVLLSGRSTLEDAGKALNRGALHGVLSKPWTLDQLRASVRFLFTHFLLAAAPEDVDRFSDLVDIDQLSHAFVETEHRRKNLATQFRELQRSFLADIDSTDDEVEQAMIDGLDQALDHPPRLQYPPGTILLREDEPLDGILVLEKGQVKLTRQANDHEIVFHSKSVGRIVGLLALSSQRRAAFTCRAVTDITVIPISLEQLEQALQTSSTLPVHFSTVLVRTLARRHRRIVELRLEVDNLNKTLAGERDQLADALRRLEAAQMRLVESEKMATLGQLSAGIAHELNNPIAAIQRASDYVCEDVSALTRELSGNELAAEILQSALESPLLSTREQRLRREALAQATGDAALARRLIKIGISTPEAYRERLGGLSQQERETQLPRLERYHQLGTALRNIRNCGERVTSLVKSLRSYARTQSEQAPTDINEGLHDTLLLFGHALRGVVLELELGDLKPVVCHPGEMNQVWTNLISNALHAMQNSGCLAIETDMPDPDHVRVRVVDSGPGIPPKHLKRIFSLNFTTKTSPAAFGLGMGLAICQQVVARHCGSITVDSEPGRTCFTVVLPVKGATITDD